MIKVLILLHVWSCIVASLAWVLQRNKSGQIGKNFPPPNIWLGFIILIFLPAAISIVSVDTAVSLPKITIFEFLSEASAVSPEKQSFAVLSFLTFYASWTVLLMGQTLWRWFQLQSLSLIPTKDSDVFNTSYVIPPLTLSWPRRCIVLPTGLEIKETLIKHERTHLKYYDAEITLCLLLLRDIMLRGLGISYLVRQWRLAIEIRADHAATELLSPSQRQDYATLLLQGLKPSGDHKDGGTLPCPTAHLTSTRHRSVKMRLNQIMQNNSNFRKHRGRMALLLTTIGAVVLGISSMEVLAKNDVDVLLSDEIVYLERVPPVMPISCPGLDLGTVDIKGKTITLNGAETYQHIAIVGSVTIKYDVRPDGTTFNLRVLRSNDPCFEPAAQASLSQWIIKSDNVGLKDVVVMMQFVMTGETHEDLEVPLNDFLQ